MSDSRKQTPKKQTPMQARTPSARKKIDFEDSSSSSSSSSDDDNSSVSSETSSNSSDDTVQARKPHPKPVPKTVAAAAAAGKKVAQKPATKRGAPKRDSARTISAASARSARYLLKNGKTGRTLRLTKDDCKRGSAVMTEIAERDPRVGDPVKKLSSIKLLSRRKGAHTSLLTFVEKKGVKTDFDYEPCKVTNVDKAAKMVDVVPVNDEGVAVANMRFSLNVTRVRASPELIFIKLPKD
jgi:hypothetical protein